MKDDAFSKLHPAVNLLFFIGAICFGVLLQHPVYLLAGIFASGVYYFMLNGRKGVKTILLMIPLFIFITLFNPIVNTRGVTVLFSYLNRPYTLEALIYGVAVAATFVLMLLWFGCYGKVLTGDKFTCLFGNLAPSLSLLLVMVFRMIPNLLQKAKQIIGARSSIGKGTAEKSSIKDKLGSGMTVIGVLTSWALEGSITTSDSMRSRGYGTSKRTSFMVYRMTKTDWILSFIMLLLLGVVIFFAANGGMNAEFLPERNITPINGFNIIGFITYLGYLLIPAALNVKEVIQWNISKSKI
ncbi:MAG: energy-coupling factor transporter transmembrane protein EcfT [Clostridia bacterium]|nr:energy-coupling factor transporter transmembrane protein EcfT [Clostridia bacterium]